jgi:hypothetical protein
MHFVILPIADVLSTITPYMLPFTTYGIMPELAFIACSIRPTKFSVPVLLTFEKITFEYCAIFPSLGSVTMFGAARPLSDVSRISGC